MPAPLNANQISAMLEKKKRELAERKEQLEKLRKQTMVVAQPTPSTSEFVPPIPQQEDTMPPPSLEEQQALMNEAIEKARKAAHLHNRIQSKVITNEILYTKVAFLSRVQLIVSTKNSTYLLFLL